MALKNPKREDPMRHRLVLFVALLAPLVLFLAACGGKGGGGY
jgi:hypothetical protein